MLKLSASLQHPLRQAARRIAAFCALAALSMQVLAAPEAAPSPAAAASSGDAISRFLHEAGLVGPATLTAAPPESAFIERVRDRASDMVLTAMNFLGVPYKRGGNSAEHGFDCSGFTRQVFEASLGLVLPRRADEQAKAPGLVAIKRDELQPGDLVFFNTLRRTFSHVGIYVGDGKFIHSPRAGGEVRVEDMRFAYWAKRYNGARRADPIADPATTETPTAALSPTRAIR
jgi:cell wall-associated NlpC family hydrolase